MGTTMYVFNSFWLLIVVFVLLLSNPNHSHSSFSRATLFPLPRSCCCGSSNSSISSTITVRSSILVADQGCLLVVGRSNRIESNHLLVKLRKRLELAVLRCQTRKAASLRSVVAMAWLHASCIPPLLLQYVRSYCSDSRNRSQQCISSLFSACLLACWRVLVWYNK